MRAARQQRRAMSSPEVKLWALLRRLPGGVKFRRQHPIGPYVADFYCPAAKLVIEVDGMVHDQAKAVVRDHVRDDYLQLLGLKVIRIPAVEVLGDAVTVADALVRLCGPSTT
jgi:very-short-patch-repair endonuclease